jgi:hypothetical protein
MVERFTVLEGELTVKRDGQTSILHEGETGVVEPGVWHDWWNASDGDTRVRGEAIPGERFSLMAEMLFRLARLGHTNAKGSAATRALRAGVRRRRVPSSAAQVQRVIFGALAPLRAGADIARPIRSSRARYLRRASDRSTRMGC